MLRSTESNPQNHMLKTENKSQLALTFLILPATKLTSRMSRDQPEAETLPPRAKGDALGRTNYFDKSPKGVSNFFYYMLLFSISNI